MSQHLWRFLYARLASPLASVVLPIVARNIPNLQAGLDGRKDLWQRLKRQIAQRNPAKPLIWFHVASAGEFLQAQPVMERCYRRGYECAVTFTSVNGYTWGQRAKFAPGFEPLVKEYLPLDTVSNMRRILALLRPAAIVYVQYDLWPNLIWEARDAGIPQFLISATIQPHSKRFSSRLSRSFYQAIYANLNGIFTVTDDDRQRFLATNPHHPNIQVVGNTRFDSVLDRKQRVAPPQLPDSILGKLIFIAGSSWPPDEECFFPALREALEQWPNLFVIIAPHEPTPEHLRHAETFFHDMPLARFTALQHTPDLACRILLVDTVGILSSLYSVATLAYVGGAFTTGVHNVMEPAVMGLPIIFGPKHHNAAEAVDLAQRGAAFSVATPDQFRAILLRFLEHPEECRRLGQMARHIIEAQAGAADRCFDLISGGIR